MKHLMLFSMLLLSAASAMAQPQDGQAATKNERSAMQMPMGDNRSPYDLTHMQSGGDKSDNLGVPYYQARSTR